MSNEERILGFLETIRAALYSGQISAAKVDAQRAFDSLSATIRHSLRINGAPADAQTLADLATLEAWADAESVDVVDRVWQCEAGGSCSLSWSTPFSAAERQRVGSDGVTESFKDFGDRHAAAEWIRTEGCNCGGAGVLMTEDDPIDRYCGCPVGVALRARETEGSK